jgi:hypothetical protein
MADMANDPGGFETFAVTSYNDEYGAASDAEIVAAFDDTAAFTAADFAMALLCSVAGASDEADTCANCESKKKLVVCKCNAVHYCGKKYFPVLASQNRPQPAAT